MVSTEGFAGTSTAVDKCGKLWSAALEPLSTFPGGPSSSTAAHDQACGVEPHSPGSTAETRTGSALAELLDSSAG